MVTKDPRRRLVEPLGSRTRKTATTDLGLEVVVRNPTVDSLLKVRKRKQQRKVVIRIKR